MSVAAAADAGQDALLDLCEGSGTVGLFGQLGGTPDAGGAWTDPNGNAHSGTFDPVTDVPGAYVYTVAGMAPCPDAQAVVTVTVNLAADAGQDAQLALCDNAAPVVLLQQLGGAPDPGGTWADPNGNAHGGTLDPANDPAGAYTYTVPGIAPCPDAQATVTVTIDAAPSAGWDAPLDLCGSAPPVALFPQLGGTPDAGGTWTDPNGNAHSGTFDPASDPPGGYT